MHYYQRYLWKKIYNLFYLLKILKLQVTRPSINLNDGPLAGQEVPHVHFHVIPRTDSNTTNPMWRTTSPQSDPDFEALSSLSQKLQLH